MNTLECLETTLDKWYLVLNMVGGFNFDTPLTGNHQGEHGEDCIHCEKAIRTRNRLTHLENLALGQIDAIKPVLYTALAQ